MKIEEVVRTLEHFAPLPLQETWDNAGLQLGLTEAEVSGVLLCLDVTEQVIDEAVSKGCNLVVSHHPLLFRGLKQITGQNDVQRAVMKAIRAGVCVVSMHTNLDNARGGVNFKIAERLGLQDVTFFARKTVDGLEAGSGVVGTFPLPMVSNVFVSVVKRQMEASVVMCNQLMRKSISLLRLRTAHSDLRHRTLRKRALHHRNLPRRHCGSVSRGAHPDGRDEYKPDYIPLKRN